MSAYDDIILGTTSLMVYCPLQDDGLDISPDPVVMYTPNGSPVFVANNMHWAGSKSLNVSAYSDAAYVSLPLASLSSPIKCAEVWYIHANNGSFSAVLGLRFKRQDKWDSCRLFHSSVGGILGIDDFIGITPNIYPSTENVNNPVSTHYLVQIENGNTVVYVDGIKDTSLELTGVNVFETTQTTHITPGVYSHSSVDRGNSYVSNFAVYSDQLTQQEIDDRVAYHLDNTDPNAVPLPSITAKSVAIDIADNWGHSYMGANRFEFYLDGFRQDLLPADYTATATTTSSGSFIPEFAFDTSKSKTGDFNVEANHWLATSAINQRLLIVFNTPLEFDAIVFNGVYHTGALRTPATPQNTVITVSGQEVLSTIYDNPVGNGSVIFNDALPQRVEANVAQDYDVPLIDMELVIQNPSILQEKYEQHAGGAVTGSVTYDNPTTIGNILVSCFGLDKDSGAITVPPGWTRITTDETIYTVSGSMAYKVADGTETDVVWTWTTSQNSNNIWIAEIANATRIDVSAEDTSSNVNTNDQSTGTTTPNTVQPALAVGMWATDSARSAIEGVQSVSQNFNMLYEIIDGPATGHVGLAIATKELFDLAAVESTWSTTDPGTGDAMFGKVAVFTGDAGEVIPPIDIDGSITLPALTLSGTLDIIPPIDIDGAVTLPSLTLSGTMDISAPPIDIDGAITLPALTLAGTMDTFIVPVDIDGAITLPALTLSGTMDTFIPSITALQVTVSGLQAATTYNIKVRADSEDATSLWTEAQLTTPAE